MGWRLLNKDGSFNIARDNKKRRPFEDFYHSALSTSWPRFFWNVTLIYCAINLVFATMFFLCGHEGIVGVDHKEGGRFFLDCVFFSVQTLATIGYGRLSPFGILPNILVAIEALTGLMSMAVMTGLLFARFSRPTARVIFSSHALIGSHDGKPCLMIRVANKRYNQIVDARMTASVVMNEITKEGQEFRSPYPLKLLRSHSSIFVMSWTLLHIIDESSPLFGVSQEELTVREAEIMFTMVGVDETLSASIHARSSYTLGEILWNHRFDDMIETLPDGRRHIELHKINDVVKL